jgi:hypothetical protein
MTFEKTLEHVELYADAGRLIINAGTIAEMQEYLDRLRASHKFHTDETNFCLPLEIDSVCANGRCVQINLNLDECP